MQLGKYQAAVNQENSDPNLIRTLFWDEYVIEAEPALVQQGYPARTEGVDAAVRVALATKSTYFTVREAFAENDAVIHLLADEKTAYDKDGVMVDLELSFYMVYVKKYGDWRIAYCYSTEAGGADQAYANAKNNQYGGDNNQSC